jgi:poly(A) polymerase
MTAELPNLARTDWFAAPVVQAIFAALNREGDSVRIIGGAVRNALLGVPVGEVDFATTAIPEEVATRAEAAGLKVVPTGVDHGTLTLVGGGVGYQVTTLREDVETDGRHAVVRFGRDWVADAMRRDFTVNALSVDAEGTIHDPLGGYPDILVGRIRFIGEADRRIAEDRLRILRFFRFHAEYGAGDLDADGLSAALRARNGLRDLSAERIGQEMRRLVVARRAAETVVAMQECGVLPIVFGGIGYLASFARLAAFEAELGIAATVPLRLAALGCRVSEDAARLTERLRLANVERERMLAALAATDPFRPLPDIRGARAALYRLGAGAYRDGLALAFAWGEAAASEPVWADLLHLADRWQPPVFPLGGRDAQGFGAEGPAVGALLRAVEAWWIAEDFAPDAAALKARLQQMAAAQQ